MTERPILFTGEMVRAILEGRKTQTRRLIDMRDPLSFIGGKGDENDPDAWGWFFDGPEHHGYMVLGRGHNERFDNGQVSIPCPYGTPGDRLWVRETWQAWRQTSVEYDEWEPETDSERVRGSRIEYRATSASRGPWRPAIFMPRWASRLSLEVSDVRVQRLQDITDDDARAEGCGGTEPEPVDQGGTVYAWQGRSSAPCPRAHYFTLWNRINGARRRRVELMVGDPGYTQKRPWKTVVDTSARWDANPWVWAVTFKRLETP